MKNEDEDDIVPIDYDPREAEKAEAEKAEAEKLDSDAPTDLDLMIELLQRLDVEYTLVTDEAGATIELDSEARGMFGFKGVSITISFGPASRNEEFLFFGLSK